MRAAFLGFGMFLTSSAAFADATIAVGDPRFSQPPPRDPPPVIVVRDPDVVTPPPPVERYRSPFRLSVGPQAFVTGSDLGMGLGVAADFGTGTVGARLYAGWFRAQKQGTPDANTSPTGNGFGQYTAEITLDFNKRGSFHPVLGLGFGALHVWHPVNGDLVAGIGTARAGLEYAFAFDDADVRVGLGVTGVLPGPAPHALSELKGYALLGASIGIGF